MTTMVSEVCGSNWGTQSTNILIVAGLFRSSGGNRIMANDSNKKQGSDKSEFMGFEAEDLGFNKVVTVSKDPYKQVFGYEYYTEKAMNFFYELQSRKAAIKVNEACYFAVTIS